MTINWVERRASREKKLRSGAPALWQELIAAIQDCCDSFNTHYSDVASVKYKTVNGHRMLVDIVFLNVGGQAVSRTVVFDFNGDEQRVEWTVDGHGTTSFPMDADASSVFMMADGRPHSLDDFCWRVLEKPLFDPPKPPKPSPPPQRHSQWS